MIKKPYNLVSSFTQGTIPISKGGTGGTTATEARTNLEVYKLYKLYDNESGTTGSINLSDSAENYVFLEIYYKDGVIAGNTKIYSPNGKAFSLSVPNIMENQFFLTNAIGAISGSSLTISRQGYCNIQNNGHTFVNSNDYRILITKVYGFKY